jgi:transposase InsO family protein
MRTWAAVSSGKSGISALTSASAASECGRTPSIFSMRRYLPLWKYFHKRKNYLFAGSDAGGERAAAFYGLIGTTLCRTRHSAVYVILDIFSRYVVGWMIAPRESAYLAELLIAETIDKQNIVPDTLTLHADRGTSMRSKPVAALLVDLEVAKTHSRPHVSDDNPYSEAQFKTLKYRPDFPPRFGRFRTPAGIARTSSGGTTLSIVIPASAS